MTGQAVHADRMAELHRLAADRSPDPAVVEHHEHRAGDWARHAARQRRGVS